MKKLFFGDCLDVLKELHKEHPKGFIDLIYIDPPFNSKRDYNVLFESIDLKDTKAQKEAFADTWSNVSYLDTLEELKELDLDLYKLLKTFDEINISQSAVSYLTTMAIRIYFMHKVLKETGSFYLHCDPTMSHYLKLVCDIIFGTRNYRNEITWKRSDTHNDAKTKYPNVSDSILFYAKSEKSNFNTQYTSHAEKTLKEWYKLLEFPDGTIRPMTKEEIKTQVIPEGSRRFNTADMTSPNPRPNLMYNYKGYPYPTKGWRYSLDTMEKLDKEGKLLFPKIQTGRIMLKRYLDEQKGVVVGDNWTDISQLRAADQERLGYPTQKPIALLERILTASSNEEDLVADFFCGCGTTIAAAENLKRNWIGADISHLAIKLIVDRLTSSAPQARARKLRNEIEIKGFPRDVASAFELAENTNDGRFGFQEWIVEVMLGGVLNPKRTADGGWDGYITFEKPDVKEKGIVLIEVKSGNVNVKNVREFIQVVGKREADIGVFVCFQKQVTQPMLKEAKQQGHFDEKLFGNRIDKIQILTVEDLLEGKEINLPMGMYKKTTFKSADTKRTDDGHVQGNIFE